MQIKSANKQRGGPKGLKEETKTPQVEEFNPPNDYDDAYENYFENQMMQDMEGIEQYEQQIDYFEELKKVEDKIAKNGPTPKTQVAKSKKQIQADDDGLDDEYLMEDNIDQIESELT